jgi:hypothetical protein
MNRVEELMKVAFDASRRTWRSSEYKDGVRAVLEFRFGRATLPELPEMPGTAASDAYLAGMEEGWMLLVRFEQASAPQVSGAECHLWLEEQRARVMDNLAYRSGARPTREMALPRSFVVMEAIQRRLPGVVPRYPWESETVGAQEGPTAGGDDHAPHTPS